MLRKWIILGLLFGAIIFRVWLVFREAEIKFFGPFNTASYGDYRLNITFSKNIGKVERRFQALEEETRELKALLESLDVIEPKNIVSSVREVAFNDLAFVTAATRDHFDEAYRDASNRGALYLITLEKKEIDEKIDKVLLEDMKNRT
ncbi:unnamed protein product [Enterobius vermicularis]|uniref:DUF5667 domain-containing protein n=1 Tax=Enterobius vermicularis TaxID=51028 RepID=A0A0N4VMC6_ENTVE|nr:unnamed protein product [Enterobius vermicularis]